MGYLVLKKPTYFATHGQFTFSPIEKQNNLSSQFSLYSFLISFQTLFLPCPGNQINSFHPAGEDKEVAKGFYPLILFLLPTFPLLTSSWKLFTLTLQHDSLFWFMFEAIYKTSLFCLMLLCTQSWLSKITTEDFGGRISNPDLSVKEESSAPGTVAVVAFPAFFILFSAIFICLLFRSCPPGRGVVAPLLLMNTSQLTLFRSQCNQSFHAHTDILITVKCNLYQSTNIEYIHCT